MYQTTKSLRLGVIPGLFIAIVALGTFGGQLNAQNPADGDAFLSGDSTKQEAARGRFSIDAAKLPPEPDPIGVVPPSPKALPTPMGTVLPPGPKVMPTPMGIVRPPSPNGGIDPIGTVPPSPKGVIDPMGTVPPSPKGAIDPMGTVPPSPKGAIDPMGTVPPSPKGAIDPMGGVPPTPKAMPTPMGIVIAPAPSTKATTSKVQPVTSKPVIAK
jgi:hypothetical protein